MTEDECEHGIFGEPCPDCIKEYYEDDLVEATNEDISSDGTGERIFIGYLPARMAGSHGQHNDCAGVC